MIIKKILYLGLVIVLVLTLSSCATQPKAKPGYVEYDIQVATPYLRHDITHVVAPGETMWRLGKMYGVSIDDIMRANNLKKAEELEIGQKLVIPKAAPLVPVVPLYKSDKWKYIIIHHSATDEGSALFFNRSHQGRGFWQGLGYHFVIDNGSKGKQDGQIEISPRWIKQQDGAHCKAGSMNYKGIGVCLVGNFSKERLSEKQIDSLVYLVNRLKNFYDIPVRNIMGHGRVHGARTECPGKYFPWKEFYSRLN